MSLSGDYPEVEETVLLFHLNLFLLGVIYCFQWLYLIRRPALLEPGVLDAWIIRKGILRSLVVPGVSLLAIRISFVVRVSRLPKRPGDPGPFYQPDACR